MEKRIGVIAILIEGKKSVPEINALLSRHSSIILARQGLPFRERGIQVISLIIEGTTDEVGALSGSLGRLDHVTVKTALVPRVKKEHDDDNHDGNKNFS